jgi:streptomycin 3"-adenylyltransferase
MIALPYIYHIQEHKHSLFYAEGKSMLHSYSTEVLQQLNDSLALLQSIFGSDLLGVYLYGSALVGGLQKYSDIDLFVVINRTSTQEEKKRLISGLLPISGIYMKSSKPPIEMTIIEKSMVNPWQYPPHFDFQYGEWLRQSFEQGIIELSPSNEMPDLAIIITQILLKNQILWGAEAKELLLQIPYHDFIKAMTDDLERLVGDLEGDTRNVVLTLARIWCTIATSTIQSKPAAADWALEHLPANYQLVLKRANAICIGEEDEHWGDIQKLLKPSVDFIVNEINKQIAVINVDDFDKEITLAE